MKLLTLPAFSLLVNAISIDLTRRETPLEVQLEMVGNTAVKASITNAGSTALKVFKTGSILDSNAVEKVKVYQGGKQCLRSKTYHEILIIFLGSQVPFSGIRLYVSTKGLDDTAFQSIAAGETIETTFDMAETHDLSPGGHYEVVSNGALSYADVDSTEIIDIAPFKSNIIAALVDGAKAAAKRQFFLSKTKRTIVQSDCTGTQRDSLLKAIGVCSTRAANAAAAAQTNSAKIVEYFKQDTATVRSTVSGVFTKVANECNSTTTGISKQYCTDQSRNCVGGVIAYTAPAQSYIVNCPGYFSQMVERTTTCHHDDKPFVTIHESTHLSQIKGTDDYGVYGYAAVQRLTAAQNLNHADTYALFANGESLRQVVSGK